MGRKVSTPLLFILFATSVLSASFAAGVHRKLIADSAVQVEYLMKEFPTNKLKSINKIIIAHPRILTVRANDYGSYDPSPTLDKPSFKQIPN